MSMTPQRWAFLNEYARTIVGDTDEQLATMMDRAVAAGLPRIAVSPDVGRLLQILVSLTPGRMALELGTLAGYSGTWISRGLQPGGRLLTIEYEDRHADFAQSEFERAGIAVDIIRGPALEVLPRLANDLAPGSIDFVFLDAVKAEYVDYYRLVKPLMAPGSVLVADNVYATGQGWIDEGYGTDEFNRIVASDPDFLTTLTPMREGLLVALRIS